MGTPSFIAFPPHGIMSAPPPPLPFCRRQLLARMCVLREEVHDLMREQALLGSSSSRQAGEPAPPAAPAPPKPQPPRLHPKYKDPTFQAAEVSEPGSRTAGQAGAAPAASTGFGRPRPAQRGKRRGAAEQPPAQEVEVEVVGAGLQCGWDEEEEEEEGVLVQPQPVGPEPSPAAAAAEEAGAGQREPGFVAPYAAMGAVPRSAVAFLKEVLAVQSSEKRWVLGSGLWRGWLRELGL